MPRYAKALIASGILVVLLVLGGCTYRANALSYVDSYELGYKFDARTGKIEVLPRTGWFGRTPFLEHIDTVDLRPLQVCINANARVLNCKLVKFNPAGLLLFLEWHGRGDYGQDTLNPILMSYAYDGSGRSYPFLTVLRELKNEELDNATPSPVVAEPAAPAPQQP